MNWKMYGLIGGISVLIMLIAVICNDNTHSLISDIVKNLAFGCVASTIVALLIEIGNIKEQNDKAGMLKLGHVCVVLLLKTKIIVRKNILGLNGMR